jgi:hypothetical protein
MWIPATARKMMSRVIFVLDIFHHETYYPVLEELEDPEHPVY